MDQKVLISAFLSYLTSVVILNLRYKLTLCQVYIYGIVFILKIGMENLNKYEKEKLLNLLEYSESDFNVLFEKLNEIITENDNVFDVLLKILQQGLNIREATLLGLYYGQKNGYKKAKLELENEIKDKLFRAFKNNQ